jgi:DNA primase
MALSDDIKARLDIVDVVSQHVPDLKKSGRNFTARCPFHQERSPSFVVFPERQSWHCFGACGIGGDLFSFVMKAENLEFTEALKQLAQRAGISVPERRSTQSAPRSPLLAVNEAALRFFQEALEADRGSLARDYLAARGLGAEAISQFTLGYSPSTGDELLRSLQAQDISTEQLQAAGLITQGEAGLQPRDLFRGRLMFTIRDARGNIVGFAGRTLDGSNPKYLNTPQTQLFDKGHLLYAMDLAKESVDQEGVAVVVEGYMDVIAAHEHGYRNVVASMGTALTEHQVAHLKEHAQAFVLALDPDTAGQEATLRSLEGSWHVAGQQHAPGRRGARSGLYQRPADLQVLRVAMLPEGKDPDELIRADPPRWHRLINEAVPVVDYLFEALSRRVDTQSSQGKAELTDRLFPLIAAMENPYDQDRYFQRLAVLLGVTTAMLEAGVGRPHPRRPQPRSQTRTAAPDATSVFVQVERDSLEEYALALLLQGSELLARAGELPEEHLHRHENRALLRLICEAGTMGVDSVKPPDELTDHLERLQGLDLPPADRGQQQEDFTACVRRLEERYLRELKAQEAVVLAQAPGESPIQEDQITGVNQRLKELFTGIGPPTSNGS